MEIGMSPLAYIGGTKEEMRRLPPKTNGSGFGGDEGTKGSGDAAEDRHHRQGEDHPPDQRGQQVVRRADPDHRERADRYRQPDG